MAIRFFDMFAGIGGFRSGLEAVGGFECIGHCEIDKKANQAYNAIYQPKGEIYFEDATKIDPNDLPDIDLICAGFPCQSFSVAGKRLGFRDDTRGTLFFEVARIAEAKRPPLLLLENVPGLLSHDGGKTLFTIFSTLVELGYDLEWCVHNSAFFGVPQQRRRLYIVGYLGNRCTGELFPLDCGDAKNLKQLIPGPQGQRVYDPSGSACTQCAGSGGWGGKTGLYFIDMNPNPVITEHARCINPKVEEMLKELADRLYHTSGKKQYGYLKSDVKAIVNRIVMELAADERIAALYDLWYEQREKVLGIYTQDLPERIPLVDNEEFKSVKNAVIQEAMNILAEITPVDETMDDFVVEDTEPEPEEIETAEQESESAVPMSDRERISAMWKYYRQAKELLDRESEDYDPNRAVDLLIESAKLGCDVAKYRLGKMFLRGDDVTKNVDYALRWLEEAAADGNQYAEYLLGKTLLRGEDTEQDLSRAEDLLKRSSDQGNRYAKYTLGKAYLEGQLLLQNIPEAIRLLTESADSGFAPAQYLLGKLLSQGEVVPKDLERAIDYLERATGQDNPYAAYLAGKLRLTEEDIKDILRAIKNFEIAAENGNHFAEYQLGKLYLYGREIDRDYDKAIDYLTTAAQHGNQYAEQLLHSIKSNKNWSAAMGSIRLLHHLARLLQNRLEDERKDKIGGIDRKLKRKIDEKKQAHGIKQ